jgi:serine/threonine-protein kinase
LPPDAPRGLCPNCLLGAALSRPGDGPAARTAHTATFRPAGSLAVLAEAVAGLPRVLLHDDQDASGVDAVVQPASAELPPLPGRSPRLQLFGEIGRGGMGAVLKGRDIDLGRDLAVKVLLEKHRDKPDLIRRFVEEAQIAGQLQHPGVVPVYELGAFADRRPYFTMKLVKGRTLAAVLASRSDVAEGRMDLLAMLLRVAQTVAFAHARGVIHRDLKPSNVMVGGFGEVQVMDWGLAKVLPKGGAAADAGREALAETVIATVRSGSDSDHSHAGSVLGTPAYMAPEQARGEVERVDERADVFALGSMLCEVLTGRPAFVGRSPGEVQRTAALGDLSDAVARLDACGADAELVGLAKGSLARERDDRPRAAAAVVERLGDYLASIEHRLRAAEVERAAEAARAEEARVRVVVERSRRRAQVGLAASLLLLTTLGGLTFTYLLQQRLARRAAADRVLAEAASLLNQAGKRPEDPTAWHAALAALAPIDPGALPAEARGRLDELRRQARDGEAAATADQDLLARLIDIRSALADDPDGAATDASYAAAFAAAGIDPDGGDPAGAGARVARRPKPVAAALVAALDHWAAVRRDREPKGPGWARVLAAARAADPDPDRDALRAALLVEDKAARLGRLRPLAGRAAAGSWAPASLVLLGDALAGVGDVDAGVAVLRWASWSHPGDARVHDALGRMMERVRPPQPEEVIRAYSVAWGRQPELAGHALAHALEQHGRGAEAEAVWRDLVGRRPGNGRHLGCYGRHLAERGRGVEAAPVLARAIATHRAEIRLKPDDVAAHSNLGNALRDAGDLKGAIAALREAIRLRPDLVEVHSNLGAALRDAGDLTGAIAEWRATIRRKPDLAEAHDNLGLALHAAGDLRGAVAAHRAAIRLKPDLAPAHSNLGNALRASGDRPGAIAAYRAAIRLKPDDALAHTGLGAALVESGDRPGAIAAYRAAIRLRPDLAEAHNNLGNVLHAAGDLNGAIAEWRATIRRKPDLAPAHYNLGNALGASSDLKGAIAAYRAAIRLKPDFVEAHDNLGLALHAAGDLRGAVAAHRAAIRLRPDDASAHHNLGNALGASGDPKGATTEFRAAIRLKPDDAKAHAGLGHVLHDAGDLAGAIAAYREAIRLQPDAAKAYTGLGVALSASGDLAGAIAAYREAIRLQPDYAEAHCNLGGVLRRQGRYAESLAELRTGHELGSKRADWRYPSAAWVKEAERLVTLADRLPAILGGTAQPADDAERLAFAQMAYNTRRYAGAGRLWAEALDADPRLADDRRAGHRYNAACAAALAAAGQGKGDPPPDDAARAKLRAQALGWLQAELAIWSRMLGSGLPQARPVVRQTLQHWQADPDLAGVRDAEELAKLPAAERAAWRALWADIDARLRAAVFPADPFARGH